MPIVVTLFLMNKGQREQWQADIQARQRNIVFPDTVQNEARFWRNIISGEQRLTPVQAVGLAVMLFMIAVPLWALIKWMRYSVVAWLVVALCVGAVLFLRWRAVKALSQLRRSKRTTFTSQRNHHN